MGPSRAVDAVNQALHSPLLETSPEGAKAVLLGISGGRDLKMTEINEAAKVVAQTADPGARIIFGAYYDKNLKPNQIKVTVVAAGFNSSQSTALFGGNHFAESRQNGFGRQGAKALQPRDSGAMPQKDESADEFIASSSRSGSPIDVKKEGNKPAAASTSSNGKEKESDAWDIPAFLRRRKK
jgi:cell division GTPase FtsZ